MAQWYCKYCGFGPHNPDIHTACIECGRMNTVDSSDSITSLERCCNDLEVQDGDGEI